MIYIIGRLVLYFWQHVFLSMYDVFQNLFRTFYFIEIQHVWLEYEHWKFSTGSPVVHGVKNIRQF